MSAFQEQLCEACGETFKIHPDANAAETGYCSPSCETSGRDLA